MRLHGNKLTTPALVFLLILGLTAAGCGKTAAPEAPAAHTGSLVETPANANGGETAETPANTNGGEPTGTPADTNGGEPTGTPADVSGALSEASAGATAENAIDLSDGSLAGVFIDFNDPGTFAEAAEIGSGFGDGGDPAGKNPGLQGDGIGVSLVGDGQPVARVSQDGVNGVQVGNFLYVIVSDPALASVNTVQLEITYWRPSAPAGLNIHYNTVYPGNFSGYEAYRAAALPAAGSGDSWVTSGTVLEGANFAVGAQNQGAHFRIETVNAIVQSIKITEIPPTDAEAVQLAAEALTWDAIKGENIQADLVQANLVLNTSGSSRTVIAWASSDETVISSAGGAVTRQAVNTPVTLTAAIGKGESSQVKTFDLIVRGAGEGIDKDAVNHMMNKLTWDFIKGVNPSQADGGMDNVTTYLVLPSMGDNMTDISWATSDAMLITDAGIIPADRPDAGGAVNITATVSRGSETSAKTFALTVPGRYDYAKHVRPAIAQINDAKDYAVSDFNVAAFGAKTIDQANAEGLPEFCNREAFQAAIDAAYADGGGVVYAPAGTYAFRTETAHTQNVSNAGASTVYHYKQVLDLKAGVQLRGEWDDPDAADYDGKIDGTILAVFAGHNTGNSDTYAESDERENQTGGKKVANVSDRFINMVEGTGVTNLSVWYPNQTMDDIVPYPWTFMQRAGNSATLDNITLVNAYNGFISLPSEMHYVVNSNMTALRKGIVVHVCTDIGRIENVDISPDYWENSGLPGAPSAGSVKAYTQSHETIGFQMHRSDWEYVAGLRVTGYDTGLWIGREPGGDEAPNAQFYGIRTEDCGAGLYVDHANGFGLLISNSELGGGSAVHVNERFDTSVQFNGVTFNGPVVSDARGGVLSFESCLFNDAGAYALNFNNAGRALVTQSNFIQPAQHASLADGFGTFKSVNSGYNLDINSPDLSGLALDVTGGGDSTIKQIVNDTAYILESIPQNVPTDIAVHPRPTSRNILRVDFPRSLTGAAPAVDVSAQLQEALDYMGDNGGGTVYLPGGRYLVNSPVTVPAGVELRGTWDVQHHTQGGGTAIFTNYTGDNGGTGASLIQLGENAGLRGISITQDNLAKANIDIDRPESVPETPFLVQGQGPGVYAVNVTFPIGDKGIDLASYNTSGHYVDYLGGILLRAGIWVGGGAEGGFIRNMQFNPHYALRLPGGQGYTAPSGDIYGFVQRYFSALKFADVEDQTIFNNFVYGSVYGVQFLQDEITGQYPGKMTMIGHGSDGCTYSLFVEDAGPETKIIAINSELVNTNIPTQPDRAYVLMGAEPGDAHVDPNAQLVLYNSAFWGSPSLAGAVVNNGILRINQANFNALPGGKPGIDVQSGRAHVYSSYFQPLKNGSGSNVYAMLRENGTSIELSNNYYSSGVKSGAPANNPQGVYGADLAE